MIFFSDRIKIAKSYRLWCKKQKIKESPEAMLAYLQTIELLNEDKWEHGKGLKKGVRHDS